MSSHREVQNQPNIKDFAKKISDKIGIPYGDALSMIETTIHAQNNQVKN